MEHDLLYLGVQLLVSMLVDDSVMCLTAILLFHQASCVACYGKACSVSQGLTASNCMLVMKSSTAPCGHSHILEPLDAHPKDD